MVAGLLKSMGAHVASEGSADQWNPKGYNENTDAVKINELILQLGGAAWDIPHLFSATEALRSAHENGLGDKIRACVTKACSERKFHSRVSVLKDPRFCVTLPFWQMALMGHRQIDCVVRTRRSVNGSIQSLMARDGLPQKRAERITHEYLHLADVLARYVDVMVDYDGLLDYSSDVTDFEKDMKDAADRCGAGSSVWTQPIDASYVDPSLRHH